MRIYGNIHILSIFHNWKNYIWSFRVCFVNPIPYILFKRGNTHRSELSLSSRSRELVDATLGDVLKKLSDPFPVSDSEFLDSILRILKYFILLNSADIFILILMFLILP